MSWLKKLLPSRIKTNGASRRTVPEGIWTKCPGCGGAVGLDYVVCPACGHRLSGGCTKCGRVLQPGWSFCPYCASSTEAKRSRRLRDSRRQLELPPPAKISEFKKS